MNSDRIEVHKPCSVDWDLMSGDERTRLCHECDKQVYDFTHMSRSQIEKLIVSADGRLCARFSRRADGTIETADSLTAPILRRRQRVPSSVSATLSTVLSLCTSAFAQSPARAFAPHTQRYSFILQHERESKDQSRGKTAELHGTIFDPTDAVIPQVAVSLVNEGTKKEYTTTTNDEGVYRFQNLVPGVYTFRAQSSGFRVFTKSQLDLKAGKEVRLDTTLQLGMLMGEIVTVKRDSPLKTISKVLLFPYRALKRITNTSR